MLRHFTAVIAKGHSAIKEVVEANTKTANTPTINFASCLASYVQNTIEIFKCSQLTASDASVLQLAHLTLSSLSLEQADSAFDKGAFRKLAFLSLLMIFLIFFEESSGGAKAH